MKINYTAMKIGAAALGCAMMTGNICRGEEVAARSISSLAEVQQAMIPSTDRDWSFSLSAGWSSKYVTEGLDCLPHSGIWEVAPGISWKDFTLGAWYAGGDSANYDELDLVLATPGTWVTGPSIPGTNTSSISRRITMWPIRP